MARYVIATRLSRRSLQQRTKAATQLGAHVASVLPESTVVHGSDVPGGRSVRLVDADDDRISELREAASEDLIIEPEIPRFPQRSIPLRYRGFETVTATLGSQWQIRVRVVGPDGRRLVGVAVRVQYTGPRQVEQRATTGPDGTCVFFHDPPWIPVALMAEPGRGYWRHVVHHPTDGLTVQLAPLPTASIQWWHEMVGATSDSSGAGIRVGVVDTGCDRSHEALRHVLDAGAFVDGQHHPGAGADIDDHGTHVCGLIGGRGTPLGIAPGAALSSARVFPSDRPANQVDIASAIDALAAAGADLVNLSLGSNQPSALELDAIQAAADHGTLCVCAAGNDYGREPVDYPAAYPDTLAVSALGALGVAPPGTVAAENLPVQADRYGSDGLFLAAFSNFGTTVNVTAPGMAMISSVPGGYADMDGTSMAAPVVTGLLAGLLSGDPQWAALPRSGIRVGYAVSTLLRQARDIGIARRYQGHGVPRLRP